MKTVFDRYRKFYKKPDAHEKAQVTSVTIERVDDDHSPVQWSPELELAKPDLSGNDKKEPSADVGKLIRQLLDQESAIRNQREKYRMNYYKLEAQKAHQEEFVQNYRIIQSFTEQLAPIYLKRKRLEATGELEDVKQLTQDEENKIRSLKYEKKRLIDKKSKLQSKINNHLAFANGPRNLPKWEGEMEMVNLNIYELDEQIRKIQEA